MANEQTNQTKNLGNYARRHPLRMASTALFLGFGAGMLAKSRNQKNSAQKFLDKF